jgi:hypothetical protein
MTVDIYTYIMHATFVISVCAHIHIYILYFYVCDVSYVCDVKYVYACDPSLIVYTYIYDHIYIYVYICYIIHTCCIHNTTGAGNPRTVDQGPVDGESSQQLSVGLVTFRVDIHFQEE